MRRWLACSLSLVPLLGQDAILEHARHLALERAANMANFVAEETAKRYSGYTGSSKWKLEDTIVDEITVNGIQISRRNWRRNGKPAPRFDGDGMPTTGFGAALKPLFDTQCPTTLELQGSEEVRGKPASAYRFSSPANGCFGNLYGILGGYNAARTGRVLIDAVTGEVLQFEEESTGFPKGFGFVQRNQIMTWDSVKIGDDAHWLPVAADFIWRGEHGALYRTTVEYRNHRHFEAASNITFK
jgi:hypothetical protein